MIAPPSSPLPANPQDVFGEGKQAHHFSEPPSPRPRPLPPLPAVTSTADQSTPLRVQMASASARPAALVSACKEVLVTRTPSATCSRKTASAFPRCFGFALL